MRSGERSVGELVAALGEVLGELALVDVSAAGDAEVRGIVPALLAAVNQVDALAAAAVDSFDTRALSELDGFRSGRSWLVAFGRMSQGAASGWLARGRLHRHLPVTAAAARRGLVSAEQLGVVGKLAGHVGIGAVVRFDRVLAGLATAAGPGELAGACARIQAHVDPDGDPPDPKAEHERRELVLSRCGSMTYLRGRLDPEGAAALQTALDALMKPAAAGDDTRTGAHRGAAARRRPDRAGPPPAAGRHPAHRRRPPPPGRHPDHPHHAHRPRSPDRPRADKPRAGRRR